MNARIKRVLVLIVGWGFILLGIVGLFLPILQGVLFLLMGSIILSSEAVPRRKPRPELAGGCGTFPANASAIDALP